MSTSGLLQAITAYNDLWKPGGLAAIHEVIDPSFRRHGSSGELVGIASLRDYIAHYLRAFPDLTFTVDDWFGSTDRILVRYGLKATHCGPFMGVEPTSRTIAITGAAIYRAAGGRICEIWDYLDLYDLERQLGAPALGLRPGLAF